MKRILLAALLCACEPPPQDVDTISHALSLTNPFPNEAAVRVWVGTWVSGNEVVVVWQRISDNYCFKNNLTNTYIGGSAYFDGNAEVYGSNGNDVMGHVISSGYACGYDLVGPNEKYSSTVINLHGRGGDDWIDCYAGRDTGTGNNSCFGDDGSDILRAWGHFRPNYLYGGNGNDKLTVMAPYSTNTFYMYGEGGDDCFSWPGTASWTGAVDGGAGNADFAQDISSPVVNVEQLTTNNCNL